MEGTPSPVLDAGAESVPELVEGWVSLDAGPGLTALGLGMAALAYLIGGGGLGATISAGLKLSRDLVLITGAVMTALVALTVDWIAALIEKTLRAGEVVGKKKQAAAREAAAAEERKASAAAAGSQVRGRRDGAS